MQRIKTIDTLRGLSMMWMFLGHLLDWWMTSQDYWVTSITHSIMDVIGTSAFLFVAGISTALSYRHRTMKTETFVDYTPKTVRNEYMSRAFIIFIIAIIYNFLIALSINDLSWIWTWFVLLTIAISLLLAWPLLKTPYWFRICIAGSIWILNIFILEFLSNYKGDSNIYGILYHFLFNKLDLDSPLIFFPFFLIGTVIGDIIMEANMKEDHKERREFIKKNLITPSIVIGLILILVGLLITFPDQREIYKSGFITEFPSFMNRGSFQWTIYTMGILLTLMSLLLYIEEYEVIKTKKSYRFLFYFSYYSFTVFLSHNIMYFLFRRQVSAFFIWFFVLGAILLWGFMLRAIYNSKWKNEASIKIWIGKLGKGLANKFEKRREDNQ